MKRLLNGSVLRAPLVTSIAITLAFSACKTPVGIRETGFQRVHMGFRESVLDGQSLSKGTRMLLEYFGLEGRYRDAPAETVAELTAIARREELRSLHVGIAEMHYDIALDHGDRSHFLASAIHAYLYLLGEGFEDEPNPYSRDFRMACDLYNRGLAQALREPSGEMLIGDIDFETPLGSVAIQHTRPGFPWGEADFSTFLPADGFEIRGLRERIRSSGLGVPLIAVQSGEGAAALSAENVGRGIKLPATAFLRLNGGLDELEAGELTATLELYLGTDELTVEFGERSVPLETDLTAPLAYTLENSEIWKFGIRTFLKGGTADHQAGVFMLQPYQERKIPLVLVHGTASSPAAWAQTINGVLADRRIGKRYQVWLAFYNTGNPIAYSASLVREALQDLVEGLDPEGDDAGLSRMVLVGHSQGGLVSRLLVCSSGEEVWHAISDVPFEEYPLADAHRDLLRRAIFFEPLPFVERVVFISTPHRGSYVAGGRIGRLARRLISLPANLADFAQAHLTRQDLPPELRRIPTSVENMEPSSRFVQAVGSLPFAERVHLNSIVAVKPGGGPVEEGDDGVVKYSSAHLDNAESELVVRYGHSCQGAPETIGELRRILFEHVGVVRSQPAAPEPQRR